MTETKTGKSRSNEKEIRVESRLIDFMVLMKIWDRIMEFSEVYVLISCSLSTCVWL
jgi:hypothetical protein